MQKRRVDKMLERLAHRTKRSKKKGNAKMTPIKEIDETVDEDTKRDTARAKLESQRLKLNQSLLKSNSQY